MKKSYLLFFTLLAFSCQLDNGPEPQVPDRLEIVSASDEAKDLFSKWMGNSPNAKTLSQYSSGDLMQIRRNGMNRYAVPKIGDPNPSLSFVFDDKNKVDMSFISTSIVNRDRTVTSKIFTLDNKLVGTFVHNPDGSLNGTPVVHGFWEWFNEVDDCFGTVGAPFESNIANIAFEAVAGVVTRGMWFPALVSVCLGVGSGLYYQKY